MVFGQLFEANLLEVEDNVGDILLYTLDSVQLMCDAVDTDRVDGETESEESRMRLSALPIVWP